VWHSLLEPLCLFFTSFCPHFKFLRRGFCHLVAVVKAPQRNGVWLQQMQVWFTDASVKGLCLAYISITKWIYEVCWLFTYLYPL
jgi:hypothetical protein